MGEMIEWRHKLAELGQVPGLDPEDVESGEEGPATYEFHVPPYGGALPSDQFAHSQASESQPRLQPVDESKSYIRSELDRSSDSFVFRRLPGPGQTAPASQNGSYSHLFRLAPISEHSRDGSLVGLLGRSGANSDLAP